MEAIKELLNNGAFWVFLGTAVTAYFTYKGLLIPFQKQQRKKNGNLDVSKASTFEELRAAIELLQTTAERKDLQHSKEVKRLYERIEAVEARNVQLITTNNTLYDEIEALKEKLRKAYVDRGDVKYE